MDESDKVVKIPKLKGASNYCIWNAEMRAYLGGKGLLHVTIGDELRPDDPGPTNPRSGQACPNVQETPESPEESLLEK